MAPSPSLCRGAESAARRFRSPIRVLRQCKILLRTQLQVREFWAPVWSLRNSWTALPTPALVSGRLCVRERSYWPKSARAVHSRARPLSTLCHIRVHFESQVELRMLRIQHTFPAAMLRDGSQGQFDGARAFVCQSSVTSTPTPTKLFSVKGV